MIKSKGIITVMAVLISIALMAGPCLAGDTMVSGKVTADNQLMGDDGQIYEVVDTDSGNELLQHTEKKVAVKGMVAEQDGKKMITVTSFEVIE